MMAFHGNPNLLCQVMKSDGFEGKNGSQFERINTRNHSGLLLPKVKIILTFESKTKKFVFLKRRDSNLRGDGSPIFP